MKTRNLFLAACLFSMSAASADPMEPVDPANYKAPVKVACVGDSITQGSGAGPGMSYPSQLQALLGDQWKVGNFGVSGRTLLKNGDFPYWKEKKYQEALKFLPDVVIIMLGTNDTKPQNFKHEKEFFDDYVELVNSFQGLASEPKIYVCRPCPVPDPGNFGINDKNLQVYIKKVNELAGELNLGVIDMHKALADKPKLLPDRVHPNTEGAGEMAKAVFKALTGKEAPVPAVK
jgi:lysophospholipase L1-like esterase